MIEEMDALIDNCTWDLVCLPAGKKAIGCYWVFIVKINPDGSIAWLNARLVAKWVCPDLWRGLFRHFFPLLLR